MACPGTVLRKRARRNGFNGCIHTITTADEGMKCHSSVLKVHCIDLNSISRQACRIKTLFGAKPGHVQDWKIVVYVYQNNDE